MLIPDQGNLVIKSGTKSTSEYTIKASSKAFDILSSGLYSDKIKAVIRELSTNAFDAHVDANNENTPFYVHLPTDTEPSFWIRDFGTGMPKEQIESLYTTYFDSTKTSSNDFVGCLGLGSKSPFSYTDNFSVISFFNGTKYTYTCFISEHGTPSIALLEECETEQENGLMISISVKRQDISEFHRKAKEVYRFFSCPISFNTDLQIERFDNVKNSNELFVSSNSVKGLKYIAKKSPSNAQKGNAIFVVMGNVCYPVDTSMIVDSFPDDSIFEKRFFAEYTPTNIFICCPIGSIDVAASREGLQYKKQTCLFLVNCLEEFSDACVEIVRQQNKDKSLIEQKEFIQSLGGVTGHDFFLRKILNSFGDMDSGKELIPDLDFDFRVSESTGRGSWTRKTIKFLKSITFNQKPKQEDNISNHNSNYYYRRSFEFEIHKRYFCFVKPDENSTLKAYEKRFLTDVILSNKYEKLNKFPSVVIFSSNNDFEKFKKAYPGPESRIILVDLQKPKIVRTKNTKEIQDQSVVVYNCSGKPGDQKIEYLADKNLFIKTDSIFFVKGKGFNILNVKDFFSLLKNYSCDIEEQCCFVSATTFEKLKRINKNIISANDQIENIINTASQKEIEECLIYNIFHNQAKYIHDCFKTYPEEFCDPKIKDHELKNFLQSIKKIGKENMFISKGFYFAHLFLDDYEKRNTEIFNELKNIFSKYEHIQHFVNHYATRDLAKFIATYINALN